MLEIYKENLYDLLAGDKMVSDKPAVDLKIKENPRRGIYVEGLTEEVQLERERGNIWVNRIFFGLECWEPRRTHGIA